MAQIIDEALSLTFTLQGGVTDTFIQVPIQNIIITNVTITFNNQTTTLTSSLTKPSDTTTYTYEKSLGVGVLLPIGTSILVISWNSLLVNTIVVKSVSLTGSESATGQFAYLADLYRRGINSAAPASQINAPRIVSTNTVVNLGNSSNGWLHPEYLVSVNEWSKNNASTNFNITTFINAFYGCINLTSLPSNLPLNVKSLHGMLVGTPALNASTINNWTTNTVIDMNSLFGSPNNTNNNISIDGTIKLNWNTSNVTDMGYMFYGVTGFNGDITGWDTSGVTTMSYMFDGASSFNQDLGGWNIAKVTDMTGMLSNSGLSTDNFSSALQGWSNQVVQSNITLGASGLVYDNTELTTEAVNTLVNTYSWTINSSTPINTSVGATPDFPQITAPICFQKGALISTDFGVIPIEKIDPTKHTINQKKIVAITKTYYTEDYLICFEPNSLGKNYPNKRTVMTRDHKISYLNNMVEAESFVGRFQFIYKIKYNGDILYNVLMENHDLINVNNFICETLHPSNIVAKLYNSGFSYDIKKKMCVKIENHYQKERSAKKHHLTKHCYQ